MSSRTTSRKIFELQFNSIGMVYFVCFEPVLKIDGDAVLSYSAVNHGVPQGPVLCAILFLLNVDDFLKKLKQNFSLMTR